MAIRIKCQDVTVASGALSIGLREANFGADKGNALSVEGTTGFTPIMLRGAQIKLGVPGAGTMFSATINADMIRAGRGEPIIQISDFEGTITVSWVGRLGSQTQQLQPGVPLTLTGLFG